MNLIKSFPRIFLMAILPSLTIYLLVLYLAINSGIEPILVLRDPIQACDYPTSVGMISNLGVLMWSATASISLFCSIFILQVNNNWRRLLFSGGILSLILCLDDLFLLHDRHVGQNFIYLTYSIIAIFILINFYHLIIKVDGLSFILSVSLLGLSIISDKLQDSLFIGYSTMQLYEEGFKFIGIACWLFFWSKTSLRACK